MVITARCFYAWLGIVQEPTGGRVYDDRDGTWAFAR